VVFIGLLLGSSIGPFLVVFLGLCTSEHLCSNVPLKYVLRVLTSKFVCTISGHFSHSFDSLREAPTSSLNDQRFHLFYKKNRKCLIEQGHDFRDGELTD
jgi:hypothetical protein